MGQRIQFSEREKDVIKLPLQGKGNKQIALDLGVSTRTVEFHLNNIYTKLGVNSRSEAILRLTETDLRESTGLDVRESAVPRTEESLHNLRRPIFMKRIPMNKSFILGLVLLVVTGIVCIWSMYSMSRQRSSEQEMPSDFNFVPTRQTVLSSSPAAPPATNFPLATETVAASPVTLPPTNVVIPPHTVNGYTAAIESYYVNASHVLFQVRITGGDVSFGDENYDDRIGRSELYDESGEIINSSGGWGPAVDPALYQFEFVPVTLLKGDHIKGQFAFDLENAPDYTQTLAQFRFEFDLPIYPEMRFYPKQAVTANGLEMLLDSVTVTTTFTQVYLCFPTPSFAPWTIGSEAELQIDGQEASLYNFRLLFDSALGGDLRAGSEPYWVPPTKNGRCMKGAFPIGSSNPTSLTLTVPEIEELTPDILMTHELSINYPGLSPKEAYYTYLEEHGKVYEGPWIFTVELIP